MVIRVTVFDTPYEAEYSVYRLFHDVLTSEEAFRQLGLVLGGQIGVHGGLGAALLYSLSRPSHFSSQFSSRRCSECDFPTHPSALCIYFTSLLR